MTQDLKEQFLRTVAAAAAAAAIATGVVLAGEARAQSSLTNSAEFNGGWRRTQGTENGGINVRTRDENGNRVIVDGVIQEGDSNSIYTRSDTSGVGEVFAGAGGRRSGATAIGNNLQVITQGSWNTVIINSTQINNGNVTAKSKAVLNGELYLND